MQAQWTALTAADLDEVGRLSAALHPGLPERPAGFAVKGGRLLGYGITHPWRLDDIPALDSFLKHLPSTPDCLYVHDVAIDPAARGHGAAGHLIADLRALAEARSLRKLACVSVYGTDVMWSRYGFRTRKVDTLADKLAGYGESAKYMVANVES